MKKYLLASLGLAFAFSVLPATVHAADISQTITAYAGVLSHTAAEAEAAAEAETAAEAEAAAADSETPETPAFFITTSRLHLRAEPTTSSTSLTIAALGARVEVVDFRCGEWYEVVYNGTSGYMFAEFLREIPAAVVVAFGELGEVELLDWSEARKVMTIGTSATIIDARTGISWQMASFSNGNHADVEPLTAEDTATMKQAFGGAWTWTPRPVFVVINGRTIAASLNGMPHAGSTRHNNMNGHVCLHFLGSSTHTSAPSHVRDHQNAVMEAFNSVAGVSATV